MSVRAVSHFELHVENRAQAAGYLISAFGFVPVAERAEPGGDSLLLRHGPVRIVVSQGAAVERYLEEHGEGIADVAVVCDDVAAVHARAVAAGAEPLGPAAFRGPGGVRHSLIEAGSDPFADPTGPWRPLREDEDGDAAPSSGPSWRLDHVALCIESGTLRAMADFYDAVFDLERYSGEYVEVGGQAMDSIVVRHASANVTFTLVEPDASKKPGQLDDFLDRNSGPGVQHLAFEVQDILASVRACRERGVEFMHTPDSYYDLLAARMAGTDLAIAELRETGVLADRDEWGFLLQSFTRSPYDRKTLFYELIQRRGARGFGSANIRALYEAVERERVAGG